MAVLGSPSFTGRFTDTEVLYRMAVRELERGSVNVSGSNAIELRKEKPVPISKPRTRTIVPVAV